MRALVDTLKAMGKAPKNAISPTRSEDFPEWYQQVVKAADMAENSETRGCMVIKPWGYAIWENIQQYLDGKFKETGHQNAYFPLLIPLSYLEKEAEHAEGFATECAVVTHHRLEAVKGEDGKTQMIPEGKLAEPYVIRPTSETIIGSAFSRWINSYRDLPLLINQWANVMRWEMRTRLFLRTAEFLWQEGHTAHESRECAEKEAEMIHELYEDFLRDFLAIPVIAGEKSEIERFPGAQRTLTVEAMVQDKKAIQAGTSHYLGQNFAKAQNIKFQDRDNKEAFAHTTSWGVSTRLIGTMIMAHSDDDGLVLPPQVAEKQVVIIPVTPKPDTADAVKEACAVLADSLRQKVYQGKALRVYVDDRETAGGGKKWEWIKKGAPIRIEIGPRDLEENKACFQTRLSSDKAFLTHHEISNTILEKLDDYHQQLLSRATELLERNIEFCDNVETFEAHWSSCDQPGFLLTPWNGSNEQEEQLSKKHGISIRCLPLSRVKLPCSRESGTCFITEQETNKFAVWGRSY